MLTSREGSTSPDLKVLGGEGFGTYLYGPDRTVLLHVALALAQLSDPHPYWIDIRDSHRTGDSTDPVGLGKIAEDHLYTIVEDDARPEDAEANLALWSVVRSDEPKAAVAEFTDFLRLPRLVQEAVSRSRSDGGRPVFVFANVDHVRPYYPKTATDVRPSIDAMVHAGIVPIFAAVGTPGPGRWAFDFVFEVRPDSGNDRTKGTLVCERAPPGFSVSTGQVVSFSAVPGLAQLLGPA
jgi:hypothetical protein